MNEDTNAIVAVQTDVPDYIQQDSDAPKGTEEVQKVMSPSRLYVMQGQTQDASLKEMFKTGDVIRMPERELVYKSAGWGADARSAPVQFTPILFFREFCIHNPWNMRGQLDFIRDRTFDPNHLIAKMARDRKKEKCPENGAEELSYHEHLNYLVMLRTGETISPFPVLINFSSAENKIGRAFSNLIMGRSAPIYAGVYQFVTSTHRNKKGEWEGFDVVNAIDPWVPKEEYEVYKKLHLDLKETFARGDIEVDYEAGMNSDANGATPSSTDGTTYQDPEDLDDSL